VLKGTFATLTLVLCGLGIIASAGAPPPMPAAEMLYNDALAKETAVRTALKDDPEPTVLKAVRTVIEQYEAVVRNYPASGYSDDALWRAGLLAVDAQKLFGDPREKATVSRVLRLLAREYPTSKYAKQVTAVLAQSAAIPEKAAAPEIISAALPDTPPPTKAAAPALSSKAATATTATTATTTTTTATKTTGILPTRPGPSVAIREIRRAVLPDVVRIVIEMDGEPAFHEERIADPMRIFVDLTPTTLPPALVDKTLRFDGDNDVVRQIRTGRHPDNSTRIVLEAAGVSSYSVYPLYSPYRLVIDCIRESSGAAPAVSRTLTPAPSAIVASTVPTAAPLIVTTPVSQPHPAPPPVAAISTAPLPPATAPPPPGAPAKNMDGTFSIARQLGLGVSRIVIDPGHGGHDPGAKAFGTTEAEIVLDVALRLEKLLKKVQGIDVVLTRREDEFIPLQERTAIANREGADLFLSIHVNASTAPAARGLETYYLNFASNLSAASVAARENAASGQAMGALPDFVKAIALNNKLDESRDFAAFVQHGMLDKAKESNKSLKDLGVKQAPFVVLIGAAMPSVLAEISFVTNAQEAKLLKSPAYRQKIAEGLFNAVRKYQTSLKSIDKVAEKPSGN
jgi:N-acetylmuramoyl-L-alanine amidase